MWKRWMINCSIPLILIGIQTTGGITDERYLPQLHSGDFHGAISLSRQMERKQASKASQSPRTTKTQLKVLSMFGIFNAKPCAKLSARSVLILGVSREGKKGGQILFVGGVLQEPIKPLKRFCVCSRAQRTDCSLFNLGAQASKQA
jgi:hypothetical protein